MGDQRGRRTHVVGIDFSGATLAGLKIWLAEGHITADGCVHITSCHRIAELIGMPLPVDPAWSSPDGQPPMHSPSPAPALLARRMRALSGREESLAALRQYLVRHNQAVVGMDFPFGLAAPLVPEPTWVEFAAGFGGRYPSHESFRAECSLASGGRDLRRATDVATRTPLAPTNLRISRQTYYGIRDVLAPLAAEGKASILPMQAPEPGCVWIVEACPASALKAIGCYPPYKGRRPEHRAARARILAALQPRGLVLDDATLVEVALADAEGDALDAMIAALIAARLARCLPAPVGWPESIEGVVYCELPERPQPISA